MKGFAFFNENVLKSFSDAKIFAGEKGRVATMLDIVDARITADPKKGSGIWNEWYSSASSEYFGLNHEGQPVIVVAHGNGPLSDPNRFEEIFYGKSYEHEVLGTSGLGRISNKEFLDLLDGKYGEVIIVSPQETIALYEYPFTSDSEFDTCMKDPLIKARLGSRYEEFLRKLLAYSHAYIENQRDKKNDFIIKIGGDLYNTKYKFDSKYEERLRKEQIKVLSKGAIAQFLVMGTPCYTSGNGHSSILVEIDVSGVKWDHKFIGVPMSEDGQIILHDAQRVDIDIERDIDRLIRTNLLKDETHNGPYRILKIGENTYTMYPKEGAGMDTHEPMFPVLNGEVVGDPKLFSTKGYGSPFFKYGMDEIEALMPNGANAYALDQPVPNGDDHICPIVFFKVEIDFSRRVLCKEEVFQDYELLMSLQPA